MVKLTLWLVLAAALPAADRKQELDDLLKILPPSNTRITGRISALDKSWEEWARRTGELPPDFDRMPSVPGLPEARFTTREAWPGERQRIRALFEQWFYGKMPPAPDNLRAVVTATRDENGVTVRDVRLEFGPDHRATLRVQLMIPPGQRAVPRLSDESPAHAAVGLHRRPPRLYRGHLLTLPIRIYGYADDSDPYIEIYPDYDFSCLARWAWAGMRAVDYLYTLPEVDKGKIGISRPFAQR